MAEAKLRGSSLEIVVTWDYPIMAAAEPVLIPLPERDTMVATAQSTAERMVADAHLAESGLEYHVFTPEGRPGEELIAMSSDAELLVIGSHGAGVLKELIMGSVSSYCVHHCKCPLVLVRTPD